jgi:phosphonate transport system substrate-binding protein
VYWSPKLIAIGFATIASLLAASGCSRVDEMANPASLRFAYVPSEEDPERRLNAYKELAEYLSEQLKMPVELKRTASYAPTIEALRANKVDVAMMGSFSYMIAKQKAEITPLVTRGTESGPGMYRAFIASAREKNLESMDDVINSAADLTFSFVDPASTSGHLVPRAALEKMGLRPERDFKEVVFAMNHTNSAMTIISGKVDVGAFQSSLYRRLIERGRMSPEDINILWRSEAIPNGPIIARDSLDPKIVAGITKAFLDMHAVHPLLFRELVRSSGVDGMRFWPAEDSMWDGLRAIAYSLDSMQLLQKM